MDEETAKVLEELAELYWDLHVRTTVLQEVLVDKNLITERELDVRLEQITSEVKMEAKAELWRRAAVRTLERLPKQ